MLQFEIDTPLTALADQIGHLVERGRQLAQVAATGLRQVRLAAAAAAHRARDRLDEFARMNPALDKIIRHRRDDLRLVVDRGRQHYDRRAELRARGERSGDGGQLLRTIH